MYRTIINQLLSWKDSPTRKPLVLKGARQVGKTWILQHFGKEHYANTAYINFDEDAGAKEIFKLDYNVERIIERLGIQAHTDIRPGNTLIILDEIQECPEALAALKYFDENAPEYHVVVAGSLLGVTLHSGVSFPVGKVDFLDLYPLSFGEFLMAVGEERLAKLIASGDLQETTVFHDKLNDFLKTYMITGGMPEVVNDYVRGRNLLNTRIVQSKIVEAYKRDFSKHADKSIVPRIMEIYEVIPAELAKENKKFIFGMIKKSARAREYEGALLWLTNAGIVTKVARVNKAALPLKAYADQNSFKLFALDVGLLGCEAGLRPETLYNEDGLYEEFKGAMAEQLVCQELRAKGEAPYYYSSDNSRTEIDFMVDSGAGPLPIEVKAGTSLQSKSLNYFLTKNPKIARAVKLSMMPYADNGGEIVNYPLYLAGELSKNPPQPPIPRPSRQ